LLLRDSGRISQGSWLITDIPRWSWRVSIRTRPSWLKSLRSRSVRSVPARRTSVAGDDAHDAREEHTDRYGAVPDACKHEQRPQLW